MDYSVKGRWQQNGNTCTYEAVAIDKDGNEIDKVPISIEESVAKDIEGVVKDIKEEIEKTAAAILKIRMGQKP